MARCITIYDPEDPRIAVYRDIRERDLVGREARFVAEGKVVLGALLDSRRFDVESIFLLENRLAGVEDLLAQLPEGVPFYVTNRSVMDRIVGFPMHRGILAIGRRRAAATAQELIDELPRSALLVVLSGIGNHDNIGSIFRNAAAFGADAVILDQQCCDPLYRKAIRVSVGSVLRVPFAHGGKILEISDQLACAGFRQLAFSPSAELDLREVELSSRTALVFGSEGHGLSWEVMQRMISVGIGMAPGFDSLNVAAASAIALHHFSGRCG